MKIGILRTTSSLKVDAVAHNIATALAQRGETVIHLLASGTPSPTPVKGDYPFYSSVAGGLEQIKRSSSVMESLAGQANWIVYEISAEEDAASIKALSQMADQLLLCYEESSLSLNSLPTLLQPLATLRQANACPPLRAFLVVKESSANESMKKLDAACGTVATIQGLYPNLHGFGKLLQTNEFTEAVAQGKPIIARNPTNDDALVFRAVAQDLAPSEKGDGVLRRSLKRHAAGKAPAQDGFFDLLFDKIQTLFSK